MVASKSKRIRREFADWQKDILEDFFQRNWEFCKADYIALGKIINEPPIRVKHWLNNRRHKAKITGEREGKRDWLKRRPGQPRPLVEYFQQTKYQRKSSAKSKKAPKKKVNKSTPKSTAPYEVLVDLPVGRSGAPLQLTISYVLPQESCAEERQAMKRTREDSHDENSNKKFKAAYSGSNFQTQEPSIAEILEEFENCIPEDASSLQIPTTPVPQVDEDDDFDMREFLVFGDPVAAANDEILTANVLDLDTSSSDSQQYHGVPSYQNAVQHSSNPYFYCGDFNQYPVAHHLEYPVVYQPEYPVAHQLFNNNAYMYGAVDNSWLYQ